MKWRCSSCHNHPTGGWHNDQAPKEATPEEALQMALEKEGPGRGRCGRGPSPPDPKREERLPGSVPAAQLPGSAETAQLPGTERFEGIRASPLRPTTDHRVGTQHSTLEKPPGAAAAVRPSRSSRVGPVAAWTVAELVRWWVREHAARKRDGAATARRAERHVITDPIIGDVRLIDLTQGHIERWLHAKDAELGPQSVNHMRKIVNAAINAATRMGLWEGPNVVMRTRPRRVPRKEHDWLDEDAVRRMLGQANDAWRNAFAVMA